MFWEFEYGGIKGRTAITEFQDPRLKPLGPFPRLHETDLSASSSLSNSSVNLPLAVIRQKMTQYLALRMNEA